MRPRYLLVFLLGLLAGLSVWAQDDGKEIFRQAENRFQEGRYDIALERYDELLRAYPYSDFAADAQFRRACIFYLQKRYQDSYNLFLRIERRYKTTVFFSRIPFWKGLALFELKDYSGAVRELDAFLKTDPEAEAAERALLHKALAERNLGKPEAAAETLEKLLGRTDAKSRGYPLVLLASVCYERKDYPRIAKLAETYPAAELDVAWRDRFSLLTAEASAALGDAGRAESLFRGLEGAEKDVAARAFLGSLELHFKTKKAPEVVKLLARAEDKFPASPDLLQDLRARAGLFLYREGWDREALSFLQTVWEGRKAKRPPPEAVLALAELDRAAGKGEKAAEVLAEYLAGGTTPGLALFRLGELEVELGRFKEAEARLKAYLELSAAEPKPADLVSRAIYGRAYALYRLGRYGEALSLARDADGASGPRFLLLQAKLLALLDKKREAAAKYDAYLAIEPFNLTAASDLVRLLFALGEYKTVKDKAGFYLKEGRAEGATRETLSYLAGMAELNLREYKEAARDLSSLTFSADLLPYATFYSAWAYFRLGDYGEALGRFTKSLKDTQVAELSSQAGYYAAWCAYSLGRYDEAAGFLGPYRTEGKDRALSARAVFLLAQTYLALGRTAEAREEYRRVFTNFSGTGQDDEARFEYAGLAAKLGDTGLAEKEYADFVRLYPASPLREAAFFKRGEVLYAAKRWADAEKAFSDYRSTFPSGKYSDAALYWGGLAAKEKGETFGALLLWDRLIDAYRDSPFRADVLRRSAESYASSGEYSKALGRYTELQNLYPQDATAFGVRRKMEELKLLKEGFTEREAVLTARINVSGGAATPAGRQALLELARFHVYEGKDVSKAAPLLAEVLGREKEDPASAAEAKYLQGELKRRNQDFAGAAALFLEAASSSGAVKDLVARALLRSAEMMVLSGRAAEARDLVDLLRKNFPASDWVKEGEKLLGGRP